MRWIATSLHAQVRCGDASPPLTMYRIAALRVLVSVSVMPRVEDSVGEIVPSSVGKATSIFGGTGGGTLE